MLSSLSTLLCKMHILATLVYALCISPLAWWAWVRLPRSQKAARLEASRQRRSQRLSLLERVPDVEDLVESTLAVPCAGEEASEPQSPRSCGSASSLGTIDVNDVFWVEM